MSLLGFPNHSDPTFLKNYISSFNISQSAWTLLISLRNAPTLLLVDVCLFAFEWERVCAFVTVNRTPLTSPHCFCLKSAGGGELQGYPSKNRHPTSMLNLELVCCLEVVRLCESDCGAAARVPEYTLTLGCHIERGWGARQLSLNQTQEYYIQTLCITKSWALGFIGL